MGDFSAELLSSKNVETFLKNLIKFIEEQGMKNKLVELVNISKSFGSTKVLDELCLEVKENEFLTLLGPSGCGKTTITRLINGLIPHFYEGEYSGNVSVYGMNVQSEELYNISKNWTSQGNKKRIKCRKNCAIRYINKNLR